MMRKFLFLLLLVLLSWAAQAQSFAVYGSVQSIKDKKAVEGATIVLTRVTYAEQVSLVTDAKGNFRLENVAPGLYTLEVESFGYKKVKRKVLVLDSSIDMGQIGLDENSASVKETGRAEPVFKSDADLNQVQ